MSPGFIERLEGRLRNEVTKVEAGREESIIVAKVKCDSSDNFSNVTPNVPPHLIAIKKYSSENDGKGLVIDGSTAVDVRGPQVIEVTSPLLNQTYQIRHKLPDRRNQIGNPPVSRLR